MDKTRVVLNSLPEKHLNYLKNLKATNRRAKEENHRTMYEQTKSAAVGYIKALANCGVIADNDFKVLFIWFTV